MATLDDFVSFLQGASNSAASNLSAPVDGINWLLGKAGLPVSKTPVGGSDWLRQAGFTAEPKNRNAGLLGEAVGGVMPIVAAAKAPQIAAGLNRVAANAAAPRTLHPQTGAINVKALQDAFPEIDFTLLQRGDKATLSKVVVPKEMRGSGRGSAFMGELTRLADDDAAKLALSPSSDFGGSKARLEQFYRRFGFVPNKGRARDFEIMESMYREPR